MRVWPRASLLAAFMLTASVGWPRAQQRAPTSGSLVAGKRALAAKDFVRAKGIFADYLAAHPGDVQGELGLADAELGLHEYETAELEYSKAVAAQP